MKQSQLPLNHQRPTPELRLWLADQVRAGSRPEAMLQAMTSLGWRKDVAEAALQETFRMLHDDLARQAAASMPPPPPVVQAPAQPPVQPAAAPDATPRSRVPEPALAGSPSTVFAHDKEVKVLLAMQHPRVVLFGDFLSDAECDALIRLADPRMKRSETMVTSTGLTEVNPVRTSHGMFFERGETELIRRIEERIGALLCWPVVNGEGIQVLHYHPGAEYKPHYDYFDPANPAYAPVLKRGGQRVGTLLMYLNTPTKGGGTIFPDVQLEVAPIKGNAAFFSYDRAHPSTRSLHGGSPVIEGEKWVATKWLREGRFA